jgi:glycosyltransferase involved in cell wall biosynthesis
MEALASGTPALVSNIPANCEWITDNLNGWLFRDGDAEHLAERILWIAGRRHALFRISRAARQTAEKRANWGRNFKVLLRAYEQAVVLGARG